MFSDQGRGIYPVEMREQSQTKTRPEALISINSGNPKRPAYPKPETNDGSTDDEPVSTYSESESENTLPIRSELESIRARPHKLPSY